MANRPGTFTKGDPRINRNGRPKSFDTLRKLAQQIANEIATDGDKEIVMGDEKQTQVTMLLRDLIRSNPVAFLQYAYGKPKDELEHSGSIEQSLIILPPKNETD